MDAITVMPCNHYVSVSHSASVRDKSRKRKVVSVISPESESSVRDLILTDYKSSWVNASRAERPADPSPGAGAKPHRGPVAEGDFAVTGRVYRQ